MNKKASLIARFLECIKSYLIIHNQKRMLGFLAAFAAFAFALRYDRQIIAFIQTIRILPLDILFTAFTHVGTMIAVLVLIASIIMWEKHKKDWIIPLWLSVGFTALLTYAIKYAVMRERPEAIGIAAVIAATGYSFPSAHASTAFAALPVMAKEFKKLRVLWIITVVLITLSRLYLGVHYASDVIFGALLGYCAGLFCIWIKDKQWFTRLLRVFCKFFCK